MSICCRFVQAPFVSLFLFGIYLLGTLAHGVSNFKNKPQEAASLQQVCTCREVSVASFCRACYQEDDTCHTFWPCIMDSFGSNSTKTPGQEVMPLCVTHICMLATGHSLGACRIGKAGSDWTRPAP